MLMAHTDSILYAAAVGDRFLGIIPPAVHCLLISTAGKFVCVSMHIQL